MKKIIISLALVVMACQSQAQDKYFTKTGKIYFDATTPASPEKIEGTNKSVTCVIDSKTGNLQFSVLMKGFEFERALMEEHFNENYVESSKYPKTEFRGQVTDNSTVNYHADGVYPVKVKGKMNLHGVSKDVETSGKLTIKGGKIIASAAFAIVLADYNVSIPTLVSDKVSKNASITVECVMEPLK